MLGKVVAIDKQGETLITLLPGQKESGCSSCSMEDSCSLPGSEEIRLKTSELNEKLEINDTVDVEMSSKKLLWFSASLYILPLITMLGGAISFQNQTEGWVIAGALAGLAIGLLFNIALNKFITMNQVITIRRIK